MMSILAIYPGTFDPMTNGHLDMIERASRLFSCLLVGVAENHSKKPRFTLDERLEMVRESVAHLPNVKVKGFQGLLVDFVASEDAQVLVRGVRTVSDFEFELQLAGMNRKLSPALETIFLSPSEENLFISSTLVREVAAMHGDISAFVPQAVMKAFLS